jgi:RNA polymerase sigma-70 factor (ECF subfamily)
MAMAQLLHFPLTDEQLVDRVRAGDPHAYAQIVTRYQPRLTAFARRILGGAHHDAEDVVQDALVSAHSALRRDQREIALGAWLHTIVRNRALDHLRRRRPHADIDELAPLVGDDYADPAFVAERRETFDVVLAGLHDLPERQRTALVMHELGGVSHPAIGSRLGVSEAASKTLVHRARRGLERRLAAA